LAEMLTPESEKAGAAPTLRLRRGTVASIGPGNKLGVVIDGSSPGNITKISKACSPKVGDRVVILVNGTQWTAIATVGGDGGGGGSSDPMLFSLGASQTVPANTDWNTITKVGTYRWAYTSVATFSNFPFTAAQIGWAIVEDADRSITSQTQTPQYLKQTVYQAGTSHTTRYERYSNNSGSSWQAWQEHTTVYNNAARLLGVMPLTGYSYLLAQGDDLNAKVLPGVYYTSSATVSNTLINCPFTGGAGYIVTENAQRSNYAPNAVPTYIKQIACRGSTNHQERWERYSGNSGSTWTAWERWASNADPVIETSDNNVASTDWVYMKYASGKSEALRRITFTGALNTALGNGARSATQALPDFPAGVFAANPYTFITTHSTSGVILHGVTSSTATNPGSVNLIQLTAPSATSVTVYINILCKGRWK